jgi:hypothetical protein
MRRYIDWAATVLCWDGILPFGVVAVPMIVTKLLPQFPVLAIVANVLVPIVAFFIRASIGGRRFHSSKYFGWQLMLFCIAILLLLLIDTMLILFQCGDARVMDSDWYILGCFYIVYLGTMAIAFFPIRTQVVSELEQVDNTPQN